MPSKIVVVPAYGKEYTSDREVQEAWESGEDFQIAGSRAYLNIEDAQGTGIRWVNIRYDNNRKVHVIKLASSSPLRSKLIRMAASQPKGDPLRRDLLMVLAAAQMVDLDKFQGSDSRRVDETLLALGWLILEGKKPIWVVDDRGLLGKVPNLNKELIEMAQGAATEEMSYASEAMDWESEKSLSEFTRDIERARFRIQDITSPRTGRKGYKITW